MRITPSDTLGAHYSLPFSGHNNKGCQTIYIVELDDQIYKIRKVNPNAGNFYRKFGQVFQHVKIGQDAFPQNKFIHAISGGRESAYPLKGMEHLSQGFLFWHIWEQGNNLLSPEVFSRPPQDVMKKPKQLSHITIKGRKISSSCPSYLDILYF